jgi:hypothetical protein
MYWIWNMWLIQNVPGIQWQCGRGKLKPPAYVLKCKPHTLKRSSSSNIDSPLQKKIKPVEGKIQNNFFGVTIWQHGLSIINLFSRLGFGRLYLKKKKKISLFSLYGPTVCISTELVISSSHLCTDVTILCTLFQKSFWQFQISHKHNNY